MANVLVEESSLSSIANAIRGKNGTTDTYKPAEMATAIEAIETGGGGGDLSEALKVTGNCSYKFAYNGWNKLIEDYGNQITTENITECFHMFFDSKNLISVPFDINVADKTSCNSMFKECSNMVSAPKINGKVGNMAQIFYSAHKLENIPNIECDNSTYYASGSIFGYCRNLKELPYLYNLYPDALSAMLSNCENLREIPEDWVDTWNFDRVHNYAYAYSGASMFTRCYSLRKIPKNFLDNLGGKSTTSYYGMYYSTFESCYSLNEVLNIPVTDVTYTSSMFTNTVAYCYRLKNFTFATNEDGTPKIANWKDQFIDMQSGQIGYAYYSSEILNYNSGITADKEVTDDTTYQALKDDPDWFTTKVNYSRYNHDSAVATINSLPDTSAYLAANGGTNTIKFKGASGALTDGGAINTLTEEEIAVAAAKGWTVTLA